MNLTSPETGRTFSNTELTCYRRCAREHHYRYVLRRQPVGVAEALSAGKRIHQALSLLHTGKPWELEAPLERALMKGYAVRWADAGVRIEAVDVPFVCSIGGVQMVGELDGIGVEVQSGRRFILEHKTTAEAIGPGSAYWRTVVTSDSQASTYLYAAQALGMDARYILWDVLRKSSQRGKAGETPEELEIRSLEQIAEKPDEYYQRAHVVRLDDDLREHERDVQGVVHLIMATGRLSQAPRNPDSCRRFGRLCEYFPVCFEGASLDDAERFEPRVPRGAEIVAKAAKKKGYTF